MLLNGLENNNKNLAQVLLLVLVQMWMKKATFACIGSSFTVRKTSLIINIFPSVRSSKSKHLFFLMLNVMAGQSYPWFKATGHAIHNVFHYLPLVLVMSNAIPWLGSSACPLLFIISYSMQSWVMQEQGPGHTRQTLSTMNWHHPWGLVIQKSREKMLNNILMRSFFLKLNRAKLNKARQTTYMHYFPLDYLVQQSVQLSCKWGYINMTW